MSKTVLLLLVLAAIIWIGVLAFVFGIEEDQVIITSFRNQSFVVDIDDFFSKKQMDTLQKSFDNINKVDNISEAELHCFLDKYLYCVERDTK